MINKISIKNFKKIGDAPLILDNIAKVNYLVGSNNCGKSSVLCALLAYDQLPNVAQFLKEDCDITFFDGGSTYHVDVEYMQRRSDGPIGSCIFNSEFMALNPNNRYSNGSEFPWQQLNEISASQTARYEFINYTLGLISEYLKEDIFNGNKLEIRQWPIEASINIPESYLFFDNNKIDMNFLPDGLRQLVTFSRQLNNFNYAAGNAPQNVIFCIDEPELHLHPNLQKVIPLLIDHHINNISNEFHNVYVFVATHSPFIVSAASNLVKKQKDLYTQNGGDKKAFISTQKVYRIENGICLNPNGSSGDRVVFETAKMLGMGLNDYVIAPPVQLINKSYIVYCESRGKAGSLSDSEIYNQIFRLSYNVLFISCESCEDVYHQYMAGKEFYQYQKDQVEVIGLVDNDPANSNKSNWTREGLKVLSRREIENYLYDLEIVSKLEGTNSKIIETLSSMDIVGGDVKANSILNQLLKNKQLELSKLITPETNVYKELEKDIFGTTDE